MHDRAEALNLLKQHVKSESLQPHSLGVGPAMRWYAATRNEDAEAWGIVGLLHDFDYEEHPDDHPGWGMRYLESQGWDQVLIRAVGSHNDALGISRDSLSEKYLYACDELSGLIIATALIQPNGVLDLTAASVRKKMKQKSFAASVNREDIVRGAADLGVELDEHIQFIIDALKPMAADLGLTGKPPRTEP